MFVIEDGTLTDCVSAVAAFAAFVMDCKGDGEVVSGAAGGAGHPGESSTLSAARSVGTPNSARPGKAGK